MASTESQTAKCIHEPHPDPAVEAMAREIYMDRYGSSGGVWELNETPECWWLMAIDALAKRKELFRFLELETASPSTER